MPKKAVKKNYLDQNEFRDEILLCKEKDELTPRALEMFQTMVKEISKTRMYRYETDREDCMAQAMLDILLYWRSYDPEKTQFAFAYYTRVIMNGFQKFWKKMHKLKHSNKISISAHQNSIYNI